MEARELPGGTVTLLFTDIEGSTRLLQELGREAYVRALTEHRRLLRDAVTSRGGVEVEMQGDCFHFAFPSARHAVAAAVAGQRALQEHEWESQPIRVRMGLHTGEPMQSDGLYAGLDVHRAARVMAAGHGGQVLVSQRTAELLDGELPGEIGLSDLGEHRLKDVTAPQRLYQALADGLPTEFGALQTEAIRTNLPVPATPFLGRERERRKVAELLTREGTRLVTFTGPGGTGKTRLALQAAADVSGFFPDGVFWVALAPLRDVELVLSSVAFAVGVQEEPGRPVLETLMARLAGRRVLLLLDNAEHLFPAVAEHVASVVASCPTVTVLVTSRQRLHISGEHLYAVPSLDEEEAMALFLVRASEHGISLQPDATTRQLCARLDALPLALELAAARTPLFSGEQLLERLGEVLDLFKGGRDADPRQQTLRATIEWSYELLTPDEQLLFCALSVFAGGCTYEAAERVADADPDTLLSLLDKSLVRRRDTELGPRYWMLETIREYAGERLGARAGVGEIRRRFLDNALALAEEVPFGFRERSWLQRVAAEHENIRAALLVDPIADAHLRLAAALIDFWSWTGHVSEGRSSLERLLSNSRDISEAARARAECVAGFLAMIQDDHSRSEQLLDVASGVVDRLDMHADRVLVRMVRGFIALHRGDPETAETLFSEALTITRHPGTEYLRARLLRALSVVTARKGDNERARILQEESLAAAHGTDELVQELIRADIAWLALIEGDFEKARRLAEACLATPQLLSERPNPAIQHTLVLALFGLELTAEADELARSALRGAWDQHDLQSGAGILDILGALAADRRDDARAARLTAAAEGLLRRAGFSDGELEVARSVYGSHLDVARTRAESAWETEAALGAASEFGAAVEYALADDV